MGDNNLVGPHDEDVDVQLTPPGNLFAAFGDVRGRDRHYNAVARLVGDRNHLAHGRLHPLVTPIAFQAHRHRQIEGADPDRGQTFNRGDVTEVPMPLLGLDQRDGTDPTLFLSDIVFPVADYWLASSETGGDAITKARRRRSRRVRWAI